MSDDLRGSAPILTAKDVLLEVRADVKAIGRHVDIIMSQKLDERLSAVEDQQRLWTGKAAGIALAVSVATTVLGVSATLLAMGGRISP
ncbi:MAG: hypothetical protein C0498_01275 [Anaerolinea sp.]|nr:hypothetical protein [Anaerolinea sp.]